MPADGDKRPASARGNAWWFGSIRAKMIGATVLLLAVVVAAFFAIESSELESLGAEQARSRGETVERATRQMASSLASNVAVASSAALLENSFSYMQTLVDTAARANEDVRYVVIVDEIDQPVADSRTSLGRPRRDRLVDGVTARVKATPSGQVIAMRAGAAARGQVDAESLWVFATPVVAGDDAYLGHVRVGMSMAAREREAAAARAAARARTDRALVTAGIAAVLLLLLGVGVAIFQATRLARPLRRFSEHANRIAGGDLDRRIDVGGADEIVRLSTDFNHMADRITVLLGEMEEKGALEKELEIARAVQESLVPPSTPTEAGALEVAGFFQPASRCGGDWWACRRLDADRVLVLIADVTGHGLPPALITAAAVGCCEMIPGGVGAAGVLEMLNRTVLRAAGGRFWMTCFAAIFDEANNVVEFANAGHPMPYLAHANGDRWQLRSLIARGPILGDQATIRVRAARHALAPGDVLVFFTDGLNEASNAAGEQWGEPRLRDALLDGLGPRTRPAEVRDHVVDQVRGFVDLGTQADDVTLVVARWRGRRERAAAVDAA